MGRVRLTRVLRTFAVAAFVASPVAAATLVVAEPAGAVAANVGTAAELRAAWADPATTTITLTADITLGQSPDTCLGSPLRAAGSGITVDGQGQFGIAQTCSTNRVLFDTSTEHVTLTGLTHFTGGEACSAGGGLYANGDVLVENSNVSGNVAGVLCIESNNVSGQVVESSPVGGGVYSGGATTAMNSTFTNNHAQWDGGGIASTTAPTITGSTFDGNSAGNTEGSNFFFGGGVATLAGATVSGSTFTNNSISDGEGGSCGDCAAIGGGLGADGNSTVSGSTFGTNHADCTSECENGGGAIGIVDGTVDVSGSWLNGNTANCSDACDNFGGGIVAGGVTLGGSQLTNNQVFCQDECAAIGGGFTSITLEDAAASHSFTKNLQVQSLTGWNGISLGATQTLPSNVSIDHSTLSGNTAGCVVGDCGGEGGGGYAERPQTFDVNASTVNGNQALYDGGGLGIGIAQSATVHVVNSTVTQNISGFSGALDFGENGVTTTLVYDTIVQNEVGALPDSLSQQAGGAHSSIADRPANLSAHNLTSFGTIVALPSGGPNCLITGTTTSAGYNFSDDTSCGFTDATDKVMTPNDPGLNVLGNYGGATQTMLPQAGSPVIDAIPVSACQQGPAAGVGVDQRDVTRPQLHGCDIGAVEVRGGSVNVTKVVTGTNGNPVPANGYSFSVSCSDGTTGTLTVSDATTGGTSGSLDGIVPGSTCTVTEAPVVYTNPVVTGQPTVTYNPSGPLTVPEEQTGTVTVTNDFTNINLLGAVAVQPNFTG